MPAYSERDLISCCTFPQIDMEFLICFPHLWWQQLWRGIFINRERYLVTGFW